VQSGCDGLGWIVTPFFKYPDYWGIVKADLPLPLFINIVPVADASLLWQQAQNLTSKLDGKIWNNWE